MFAVAAPQGPTLPCGVPCDPSAAGAYGALLAAPMPVLQPSTQTPLTQWIPGQPLPPVWSCSARSFMPSLLCISSLSLSLSLSLSHTLSLSGSLWVGVCVSVLVWAWACVSKRACVSCAVFFAFSHYRGRCSKDSLALPQWETMQRWHWRWRLWAYRPQPLGKRSATHVLRWLSASSLATSPVCRPSSTCMGS